MILTIILLLLSLSLVISHSDINELNEKGYTFVNTTVSSYNPDLAVSFANSYCDKNDEWLCAEVLIDI